MEWEVPVPRMDLRTDGEGSSGSSFQKFTTRDGRNQVVEIDSLHKARQVEKASEIAARNHEGHQINFRAFSNTTGNMLDGSLGPMSAGVKPSAEGKRKFGLRGGAKALPSANGEPSVVYGPGVNDSNTSALKDQ